MVILRIPGNLVSPWLVLFCVAFHLIIDRSLLGKGNCGKVNTDADFIVAIGKGLYDRNGGSNCDQVSSLLFIVTFNLPHVLVGRNRECRKRKESQDPQTT